MSPNGIQNETDAIYRIKPHDLSRVVSSGDNDSLGTITSMSEWCVRPEK